jgi:hypothetical protein
MMNITLTVLNYLKGKYPDESKYIDAAVVDHSRIVGTFVGLVNKSQHGFFVGFTKEQGRWLIHEHAGFSKPANG